MSVPSDLTFWTRVELAFGQSVGTLAELEDQENWDWTNVARVPPTSRLTTVGVTPTSPTLAPVASTPDHSGLDVSGSDGFQLIVSGLDINWTDGVHQEIICHRDDAAFAGWGLRKTAADVLTLQIGSGSAFLDYAFTSFVPPVSGPITLAVLWDQANGDAYLLQGEDFELVEFIDGTPDPPRAHPTGAPLAVGSLPTGAAPMDGSIGAAYMTPSAFGGTPAAFAAEFGTPGQRGFVDTAGNRWVINGDAVIKQVDDGEQGYVLNDQTISISQGRADETSNLTPSSTRFVLDNPDGRFTPENPLSPHYPNVRRGTPCRVRVWWEGFWHTRFAGFVDEWRVSWPDGDMSDGGTAPGEGRVEVTASGFTRRLGAASETTDSALYRAIRFQDRNGNDPGDHRVGYWPLEDGEGATVGANHGTGGGSRYREPFQILTRDNGKFAADSTLAASKPLLHFDEGGFAFRALAPIIAPGQWGVEFNCRIQEPHETGTRLMVIQCWGFEDDTVTDNIRQWELTAFPTFFRVQAINQGFQVVEEENFGPLGIPIIGGMLYDRWFRMSLRAWDDGSTVSWEWGVVPSVRWGQLLAGGTSFPGRVGRVVRIENLSVAQSGGISYGHVTTTRGLNVDPLGTAPGLVVNANAAWDGETAQDRHFRLCFENNIIAIGGPNGPRTTRMGVQRPAPLLELFAQDEGPEAAVRAESHAEVALRLTPRDSIYQSSRLLVLDADENGISAVDPILDDQRMVNDVTASQPQQDSRRIVDQPSVDTEGRYEDSIQVNVTSSTQLDAAAGWRMALGQAAGHMRIPAATFDLHVAWQLVTDWLSARPGDRVEIRNLPRPQYPLDSTEQILQGWTEEITDSTWRVTTNLTPAEPWNVGILDSGPSSDGYKIDTVGSELAEPVNTTTSTFDVAVTAGNLWTTDVAEMPFDIMVGGERMSVFTIAGASSPQTFTVARAQNGIVKSHAAGTAVNVAKPCRLGLGSGVAVTF